MEGNEWSEAASGQEDFGKVQFRPLNQGLVDGLVHVIHFVLKASDQQRVWLMAFEVV